jgi:hypothetical protein
MEASKVIITSTTRAALQNPVLPYAKKKELRQKAILEYIREQPTGAKISNKALARAANMHKMTAGSIINTLNAMARDHLITIDRKHHSTYARYTIPGDIKVTKPVATSTVAPPPREPQDSIAGRIRQGLRLVKELRQLTRVRHLDGRQRAGITEVS